MYYIKLQFYLSGRLFHLHLQNAGSPVLTERRVTSSGALEISSSSSHKYIVIPGNLRVPESAKHAKYRDPRFVLVIV